MSVTLRNGTATKDEAPYHMQAASEGASILAVCAGELELSARIVCHRSIDCGSFLHSAEGLPRDCGCSHSCLIPWSATSEPSRRRWVTTRMWKASS